MVRNSNSRSNHPPPNGRRQRRALATRQTILRAAAGVFRERGFAETGMRDIAEAADLSPANLYYYFKSKHELLYFCQEHSVNRMLAATRALNGKRLTASERLRQVITAHLTCTLDELDGAAAHTEVDALPRSLRRRIVAKRDRYEREVRRIVAEGVRRGAFVKCDPALVTRAILGALNWTAKWYRPGGRLPPAEVAESFANYLVRGLRK